MSLKLLGVRRRLLREAQQALDDRVERRIHAKEEHGEQRGHDHDHHRGHHRFLARRPRHLGGFGADLPHEFDGGTRFNLRVERVLSPDATVPQRIAVSWYGQHAATDSQTPVQPGERWQLVVRLQRPHGNANPYGFDYEAWLLEQGVRATGYVRPAGPRNVRLDAFVPRPAHVVERARAALRRHILQNMEGKRYAGVIVALVIGGPMVSPVSNLLLGSEAVL